jgi:hypothetical protein
MAVCFLAAGNILHQAHFYSWRVAVVANVFVVSMVLVLEEIGLRSHLLFGQYAFQDIFQGGASAVELWPPLGVKITPRLPALVVCLWLCMVYPTFVLTNLLCGEVGSANRSAKGSAKGSASHVCSWSWSQVVLAAGLLTVFDFISEPPMVLYGHRVWRRYAALLADARLVPTLYCHDPEAVVGTLRAIGSAAEVLPDWYYRPGQWLSWLYFDIPIQNFVGWLFGGTIIYCGLYRYLSCSGVPLLPASGRGMLSTVLFFLPVAVSNLATVVYLVVHPIHPLATRMVGSLYLVAVGVALARSGTAATRGAVQSFKSE